MQYALRSPAVRMARVESGPSLDAGESVGDARVRLSFLDGLRAVAALYVVFCHAYQELIYRAGGEGIPPIVLKALKPLAFGHYAVDVFIVLSGYCLMLPVARSVNGRLRGGMRQYLCRRARRILPPYYAALALSLVVMVMIAAVAGTGESRAAVADALSPKTLASYVTLTHNVVPGVHGKIDPPLWSVGTEWQIYFLFPMLLLPVWRRFGGLAAVVFGTAIGMIPVLLGTTWLYQAAPWYLGLFAMGMLAALISFSGSHAYEWSRRLPWGLIASCLAIVFLSIGIVKMGWYQSNRWVADILAGAAAMCLIQTCVSAVKVGRLSHPALRLLESRTAVALGAFSYSIYLIHYPLLQLAHVTLFRVDAPPMARVALMLTAVPALIVGLAYLFYLVVERRFTNQTEAAPRQSAPALSGAAQQAA